MDSDNIPTNSEEVFGTKTYAFFHEVCVNNKVTDCCSFESFGMSHKLTHLCNLTLIYKHLKWEVTGNPASTKNTAKHFAAAMAMNKLGMGMKWYNENHKPGSKLEFPFQRLENLCSNNGIEKKNTGDGENNQVARLVVSMPGSFAVPLSSITDIIQAETVAFNPVKTCKSFVCSLEEFCADSGFLEEPVYSEPMFIEGMSHNPKFRINCTVKITDSNDTFVGSVTAVTNKKQLKRIVAQKMLMKLYNQYDMEWKGPPLPLEDLEPEVEQQASKPENQMSSFASAMPMVEDSSISSMKHGVLDRFERQSTSFASVMPMINDSSIPNMERGIVNATENQASTSNQIDKEPEAARLMELIEFDKSNDNSGWSNQIPERKSLIDITEKLPLMAQSFVGEAIDFLCATAKVLTQDNAKGWLEKIVNQQISNKFSLEWITNLGVLEGNQVIGLTLRTSTSDFTVIGRGATKKKAENEASFILLDSILTLRGAVKGMITNIGL